MTRIRTLQLAAFATTAALLALAGCQSNELTVDAPLAPEPTGGPVFADTTQPVRDYSKSVSYIQNGDTEDDGSVGFRYRSKDDINVGIEPLAEVGVFAANVVTLPYTLIEERNKQSISTGAQYAPTYTAMPAVPPAPNGEVVTPGGVSGEMQPAPSLAPDAIPTTNPTADKAVAAEAAPASVLTRTATDTTGTANSTGPAFSIVGQVSRPGTYDVADLKLSQVVAAAGPSTEDTKKVRIQIDRPGEESAVTTLDQLLAGSVDDVKIKAGDVVTISVLP